MTKEEFVNNNKQHCLEEIKSIEDYRGIETTPEKVEEDLGVFYEDYLKEILKEETDDNQALSEALEYYEEGYLAFENVSYNIKSKEVKGDFLTGYGGPTIFHRVAFHEDEYRIVKAVVSRDWRDNFYPINAGDILYLDYFAHVCYSSGITRVQNSLGL